MTEPNDLSLVGDGCKFVALQVREGRQVVQQALIDARHLYTLRQLDLEYWFIGDRRGRQPVLRRTATAIDQLGRRHSVNFALHRVIATAIRLGSMPLDVQVLYDQLDQTPPVTLCQLIAPNGMLDYRDENIMATNQQNHRRRSLIAVTKDLYQAKETTIQPPNSELTLEELQREALESIGMSEDTFNSIAKPGD